MTLKTQRASAAWPTTAVLTAVVGFAAACLAGTKLRFPVHVTSNSMAPYAVRGDFGVAIRSVEVQRGDVIVFRFPFGSSSLAIKRAVILPGECMPPHAGPLEAGSIIPAVSSNGTCARVPPESFFVIGDNIEGSVDSRHFGAVPSAEIVGKVVLVVPVSRWWPG